MVSRICGSLIFADTGLSAVTEFFRAIVRWTRSSALSMASTEMAILRGLTSHS